MKKKILIISIILIIILGLVISGTFLGINLYHKSTLKNIYEAVKTNLFENNNYYYCNHYTDGDKSSSFERWRKDDEALVLNDKSIQYFNLSNGTKLAGSTETKQYTDNPDIVNSNPEAITYEEALSNIFELPSVATGISSSTYEDFYNTHKKNIKHISTETINGVECYKINYENDNWKEIDYFSKDTFLPVKAIIFNFQDGQDRTMDYKFEINTVTDADVTFNLDGYTKIQA